MILGCDTLPVLRTKPEDIQTINLFLWFVKCIKRSSVFSMSGHSKWHNIQQKKGKRDVARANVFTKLARAITVAVREGGGDASTNFSLRIAIEKAKAENMPKDNIERAIKKGTGELNDGEVLEEIMYEAVGPEGVGIMIDCITDNRNRSASEVKHVLSQFDASLGGPGAVVWQFQRLGVVRMQNVDFKMSRLSGILTPLDGVRPNGGPHTAGQNDEFELMLIDAGVQDIVKSDEGVEVRCDMVDFQKVLEAVQTFVPELSGSGLEWVAKDPMKVSDDVGEKIGALYEALEEMDDVKAVFVSV